MHLEGIRIISQLLYHSACKVSVWNFFFFFAWRIQKMHSKKTDWCAKALTWSVRQCDTSCEKRTSLHWITVLKHWVQFGVKVLELGVTDISHHFTKLLSVMKVTRCKLSAGGGVVASGHTDLSTDETDTQLRILCPIMFSWFLFNFLFFSFFVFFFYYSFQLNIFVLNLFFQIKHKYRLNMHCP